MLVSALSGRTLEIADISPEFETLSPAGPSKPEILSVGLFEPIDVVDAVILCGVDAAILEF